MRQMLSGGVIHYYKQVEHSGTRNIKEINLENDGAVFTADERFPPTISNHSITESYINSTNIISNTTELYCVFLQYELA